MLRTVYILLLDLHPGHFRERFGSEMLNVFNDASGPIQPVLLIADGLLSLIRQWILRPEFRRPPATQLVPHLVASPPQFRTLDQTTPPGSAVLSGAGLTAVTFSLFATLTGYGVHEQRFLIGARNPSQRPLPVAQSSFEAADLNTVVKVPPPLEDPLKAIGIVYFKIIRALDVLDADKDLAISPWETFTAPAALRRLDMDNDGKLSAEELGYSLGSNSTPGDVVERTRAAFMRENPVLAALDANQDREVSAFEIANSFRSLRTLDRNGDGGLTLAELLPDQQNIRAAMLFMKLDANGDERISREEREGPDESSVRGLLHGADRNNDGFVTRNELQVELRLRAEQKRQLEAARLAGGVRSVP